MECGDLKNKLCTALMENQKLRKQLNSDCGGVFSDKDQDLKRENADLEKQLSRAMAELKALKEKEELKTSQKSLCPSGVRSVRAVSPVCSVQKAPKTEPPTRKCPAPPVPSAPRRVPSATCSSTQKVQYCEPEPRRVPSPTCSSTQKVQYREREPLRLPSPTCTSTQKVQHSEPSTRRTPSPECPSNQKVEQYEPPTRRTPSPGCSSAHNFQYTEPHSRRGHGHSPCPTSRKSPSAQPCTTKSAHPCTTRSSHPSPCPARSDTSVNKYRSEDADRKTYPEAPEMPIESLQDPTVVVVSKEQFESCLNQKKQMYSESIALLPSDGGVVQNCRMDICVYDLELDNRLLDQLRNLERNPQVFVDWSFLGLEQRTVSMPAAQAQFCTNVTYFGPVSGAMADYLKEKELVVNLMLDRSNGRQTAIGQGTVDVLPALHQPSRGFVRAVPLSSELGGSANIYVSFKLHECCNSDEMPLQDEYIEVMIGRLSLEGDDTVPSNCATHLYVEYSILGYCGPDLETDSVAKCCVMQFNHSKRLKVHEENASKLEPLLRRNNTKPLRFTVIAEPCSLSETSEVEEVGRAEVNLLEEMVHKDQDIVSEQVPVYARDGKVVGSLSLTILGIGTLKNHLNDGPRHGQRH